ncbi:tRNA-modifying protein YgfZ [Shewanella sp. JM162201]|uniref:tRNA-modifying protein YgfZ n=1 Tax=Shewanella jiangmenensis TaxID=2837387 RepID=A0ABS5V3X8_9GAMM|nr:tRNA-modifying protein YgfZ [Shewanella jiangmenensis]MBT1443758.1 tRNA-modifying protein YgfZ [Shewanella jiangmenensis]
MTFTISQANWALDSDGPALSLSLLNHMGLVSVTGEQGASFIHGQVTADISSLKPGDICWGAHCDPKGRMLATFRALKKDDALLLLLPRSALEVSLPQLKKYAVFSKAELTDVSADYCLLGVAGKDAHTFVSGYFGEINAAVSYTDKGIVIRDGERYILLLDRTQANAVIAASDQPLFGADVWQAEEIRAGYPNIAGSHASEYIPQMCNLQAVGGISFTKGCYMGQETVARTKYRGGNKRALYILQGESKTPVRLESTLEIAVEGGYRKAGNIIEVVSRGGKVLMSAVLANDTAADAVLRLADDHEASFRLLPLPYSLED